MRGIIFRCLKQDLQDFGDFQDSCDRLMLVQRTLLASVERVVWWGGDRLGCVRRGDRGENSTVFPPMMYIGVAAGKSNSGTGGAGGAGPLAPPIFVKSKALAVMRFGSAFQFPGKRTKERDILPVYTRHHWGKSDRQDHQRIHLLEHHLADVAACFESLLKQPTIRKRLARAGGLSDLDETTAARLCVLVALHDIGKVNIGFQTQIWRAEDLPPNRRRPPRMGHVSDLVPILEDKDEETADWFFDALGALEIMGWDNDDGVTASGLLIAALSHHGSPLNRSDGRAANPAAWRKFGGLQPAPMCRAHRAARARLVPCRLRAGGGAPAVCPRLSAYVSGSLHIGRLARLG